MKDIESRIKETIRCIDAVAHELPTVVIIHRILGNDTIIEYMSQKGLDFVNLSFEQLRAMGRDYFRLFLNAHDAEDYIPKMLSMIMRNDPKEVFTFFQQVRSGHTNDWEWHLSSIKILLQDDTGNPLLVIVTSSQIDPENHLTHKVSRLLEENNFLRENVNKFSTLTEREKDILKHIALGKSNKEIAEVTSISINTVETHRKKIKAKLNIQSHFELSQYASAFNLI